MKAYNLNGQPYFTENDCIELELIEERDFTADELKYSKISGGAIVVDTVKRDADLADLEEKRITDIKSKAGSIITDQFPEWKQRNMLAKYNELLEVLIVGGSHSSEESAEFISLKSVWEWIKSVRQTSDDAEANGTLLKDIEWP